jgi:uncharacterized membrane protein YdjX (TVP38/TMEM64 family)
MSSSSLKTWLKRGGLLLAVVLFLLLIRQLPLKEHLGTFNEQVAAWGFWGIVVFILVYALATVAMIPGSVLTLGAGFAFGLLNGMIAVSIASTLGASLAFLVSRYLAREKIRQKFGANEKFLAVDKAVEAQGWKIVGLLRLSPAFPFTVLNYVLGLTRIKFWHYVAASWAGMLPGTLLYVYIGYLGKAAAESAIKEAPVDIYKWIYYGVAFLATLGVTIYATKLGQNAMKKNASLPSGDPS